MSKARPMGYVFPKRIKDAISGENTTFGSKFYIGAQQSYSDNALYKTKEQEEKESILKESRSSWTCPYCNKIMTHKLDQKYYNRRGMCMDCTVKVETHLKTIGLFKSYETEITLRNYKAYLLDIKAQAEDFMNNLKDETKIVNHDGSFDTIVSDNTIIRNFMKSEISDIDMKLLEVEDVDMSISAEQHLGIDTKQIISDILKREKDIAKVN